MLLIHGDSFVQGDRGQLRGYGIALGRTGYTCLACEYRLAGEALWPAQIDDVHTALAYLHHQAPSLSVDPAKIVVSGNSAGGVATLAIAVSKQGSVVRWHAGRVEPGNYLVLYWDTGTDQEHGWEWARHDRNGTELERGRCASVSRDDAAGAQAELEQQHRTVLVWQSGQRSDIVSFVGRAVGGVTAAPPRRGAVAAAADAFDSASRTAATADDLGAIVSGEGAAADLAVENLAGKAFRLIRRAARRRHEPPAPPPEA